MWRKVQSMLAGSFGMAPEIQEIQDPPQVQEIQDPPQIQEIQDPPQILEVQDPPQIQEDVEKPTVLNTEKRNVLGQVKTCYPTSFEVDTLLYGHVLIELDNVEVTFVPQWGDRVYLVYDVQPDDDQLDDDNWIQDNQLDDNWIQDKQVTKVVPQGLQVDQSCVVERVFDGFSLLGKLVFVLNKDVPSGAELHLGDLVKADLIDSEYGKFKKRAIKVTLLEKSFGKLKIKPSTLPSSGAVNECQSVSVIGPNRHVSTELLKRTRITLTLRNNIKRALHLKSVTVPTEGESQLSVVQPRESEVILEGREFTVILDVWTKFLGEAIEKIVMDFGNFKISRKFAIIVWETEEKALKAERRLVAAEFLTAPGSTAMERTRYYANKVWSDTRGVVKGESVATKRRSVPLRLGGFEVPDKLRQIYLTERRPGMFEALEREYPCLKEELNAKNYVQILSLFLHLEEIENFVLIRNYDRERAHFQRDGEYLSLLIENLAERRPSLVIGDVVRAVNPCVDKDKDKENSKAFEGIVHKVLCNRILLKFNVDFQKKYDGEYYRLEFYFSRYGLRKQHHAISKIVSIMGDDFLFPTEVVKRKVPQLELRMIEEDMFLNKSRLRWFNWNLNLIQKQAVFQILRGEGKNMPYVIFGPPGTGKSMTLVEVLLQLAENVPGARILVGTPSNSSANLITKRIIDSKVLPKSDFIRVVSFNQIEKDLIPAELMSYCATVEIGKADSSLDNMVVTESGLKMLCPMKYMGRHRVTISTNSTLGNFMQMGFRAGHFTHVLIDEAGQCTEPETVVPISLLVKDKSQVILAGDPRQLQAIVINRYSAHKKYSRSFLERLLDRPPYKKDMLTFPDSCGYNPMCLTKLLNNYRALPTMMSTYSQLFYDNELISMVSEKDSREARLLERAIPVFKTISNPLSCEIPKNQAAFFVGVNGTNMQDSDSPSWYNPEEAKQIYFLTISLYKLNVHQDQVGIITPYAKQVETIRNLFTKTEVTQPKIGSVEEFLGQERDIMMVSTVRSAQGMVDKDIQLSLGFVKSRKRMNVAISRARAMMVVFGNPHLLGLDIAWRQYIISCAQNGAYFGCNLPNCIPLKEEEI